MSTQQTFISHQNLLRLVAGLIAEGLEVVAPRKAGGKTFFAGVTDPAQIAFDPLPTAESAKALLFPKVERLLSYERLESSVRVTDHSSDEAPEKILFGLRPCDAAAMKRLGDFFAAEIPDAFVEKRRRQITIISISCASADADCFCTSCGSGPGDTTGSDLALTAVSGERYIAEPVTGRGSALLAQHEDLLEKNDPVRKEDFLANVEAVQAMSGLSARLPGAFNDPFWKEASLRCLGCGACAYICPLCSCFDIEDEGTPAKGERLRCWDSCGFSLFTLHTSGHNPRPVQSDRWRQRVMHKLSYMPARFGFSGCIGCGRCSRACPADMNLKEQIVMMAAQFDERGSQ